VHRSFGRREAIHHDQDDHLQLRGWEPFRYPKQWFCRLNTVESIRHCFDIVGLIDVFGLDPLPQCEVASFLSTKVQESMRQNAVQPTACGALLGVELGTSRPHGNKHRCAQLSYLVQIATAAHRLLHDPFRVTPVEGLEREVIAMRSPFE
jgi:hypothetical protein